MTTARMERAVRRSAAASMASYRQAARQRQDGADWATVATGLAQSVDLLLGLLAEDDSRDRRASVAFEMIGELSARMTRQDSRLGSYDQAWAALGQESAAGIEPAAPRLTVLPGGSVGPRHQVHR